MKHLPTRIGSSLRAAMPEPRTEAACDEDGSDRMTLAEPIETPVRLVRFPVVRHRTGLSRSTIWRLERQGAFPKHRQISANVVAWVEHEITAWIRAKTEDIAV